LSVKKTTIYIKLSVGGRGLKDNQFVRYKIYIFNFSLNEN